ncbi:MAG: hypothetical protein DMG14_22470 [Acidobacteria bacterium]|nr:MAG: hypothetical protein DMG14_22470 [Acidobacteriota bacterium]
MKAGLIVFLLIGAGVALVRMCTQTVIDPLSGIWIGDWGPTPSHRNAVTLILRWDGTTLTGAVNPGPHALQLTKASVETQKGAVHLEVEVPSAGREVHYVIDGTIEDGTLSGTWYNDDNKGNFRLIKK